VHKALDLYSKVEDLLGVNEVTPKLYENYFFTLQTLEFNSLLDIGCGRGEFLRQLTNQFPNAKLMGIDLSPLMVETTKSKGINAQCIDLCKLDKKFQVITAVFDMGYYAIFLWILVIIATSNAVNLTDGLDGLAVVPSIISFFTLSLIVYITGHAIISGYLLLPNIKFVGELAIVGSSFIGALIAFL
jgi:SAM-dependent methyltransferase